MIKKKYNQFKIFEKKQKKMCNNEYRKMVVFYVWEWLHAASRWRGICGLWRATLWQYVFVIWMVLQFVVGMLELMKFHAYSILLAVILVGSSASLLLGMIYVKIFAPTEWPPKGWLHWLGTEPFRWDITPSMADWCLMVSVMIERTCLSDWKERAIVKHLEIHPLAQLVIDYAKDTPPQAPTVPRPPEMYNDAVITHNALIAGCANAETPLAIARLLEESWEHHRWDSNPKRMSSWKRPPPPHILLYEPLRDAILLGESTLMLSPSAPPPRWDDDIASPTYRLIYHISRIFCCLDCMFHCILYK
jgi:hypothetical protein